LKNHPVLMAAMFAVLTAVLDASVRWLLFQEAVTPCSAIAAGVLGVAMGGFFYWWGVLERSRW
jgi:phosphate/sulfate permease